MIEIIKNMFSDHNEIKLEQKATWKNSKVFEIKHTSNNPRIKGETQRCLEISWNLMKMKQIISNLRCC